MKLIIIDYLQLIQLNHEKNLNRTQELSYITRKLKLLAQFLKLPIIVLSQLNRNVETRALKKPLLSDLKESGCISNKNNLIILNYYFNEINIINLNNIAQNIRFKSHTTNKQIVSQIEPIYLNNYDIKKYLNIFQNYMFKYEIKSEILTLTNNHKYSYQEKWIKTQYTSNNTRVNFIKKHSNIIKKTNNYFIENLYIKRIKFSKYSKCYDVNKENNFSLVSAKLILHNSIEQDADIVMILNEKNEKDLYLTEEKILDIIVCKNRNGPTGSCEIRFVPKITCFKDSKKNIV